MLSKEKYQAVMVKKLNGRFLFFGDFKKTLITLWVRVTDEAIQPVTAVDVHQYLYWNLILKVYRYV
jgi:hypothetical protein